MARITLFFVLCAAGGCTEDLVKSHVRFPAVPWCRSKSGHSSFYDANRNLCVILAHRENAIAPHSNPCPPGSGRRPEEYMCRGQIDTAFEVKCHHASSTLPTRPYFSNADYQCIQALAYVPRPKRCPEGFKLKKLIDRWGTTVGKTGTVCVAMIDTRARIEQIDPITIQNCRFIPDGRNPADWDLEDSKENQNVTYGRAENAQDQASVLTTSSSWGPPPPRLDIRSLEEGDLLPASESQTEEDLADEVLEGYQESHNYESFENQPLWLEQKPRRHKHRSPKRSLSPADSGKTEKAGPSLCARVSTSKMVVCPPGAKFSQQDDGLHCIYKAHAAAEFDPVGCKERFWWSSEFQMCISLKGYVPERHCPWGSFWPWFRRSGITRRQRNAPRYYGDETNEMRCVADSALPDNPYCPEGYWLEARREMHQPLCIPEETFPPTYSCEGIEGSVMRMDEIVQRPVCEMTWDPTVYVPGPNNPTKRQKMNNKELLRKPAAAPVDIVAAHQQVIEAEEHVRYASYADESWKEALAAAVILLKPDIAPEDTFLLEDDA